MSKKELAKDFTEEFCAERGGNFTREQIYNAFLLGYDNLPLSNYNYHQFLAYKEGRRWGGHSF